MPIDKAAIITGAKGDVSALQEWLKTELGGDRCSEYCKHEGSCVWNCFKGTTQSFALCYSIKAVLSLIGVLLNRKKLKSGAISVLLKALINSDNIRFAAFPAAFSFIAKSMLCTLRHLRKSDDGVNSLAAGFIAGFLSLFLQAKKMRATWGLFLIGRALDIFYNSLCNKGIINYSGHHLTILLTICNLSLIHISEPTRQAEISYAVFCLKKKKQ
eukprot:TRINITY_DN11007_c0_g1_i2.p1 TRINITY_DN11007_c0_g1~~TRINITY_DN11007_c0_g1_i2.p1  ORF type:complete len:214 (+),score=26.04 TRINITY_DN11007_c0_g1_i2:183-824(+)